MAKKGLAQKIASLAFENGLIVETCGSSSSAVKLMPPLVISDDLLRRGLELLQESISQAL
jgi:diaminobutyrate-2-oxoglutarate transaminase